MQVKFEGNTYNIQENGKIQNVETKGYIRKKEKVSAILELVEKIKEEQAKKVEKSAHKKPSQNEYKLNDTIKAQVLHEFLVLNFDIKTIEKETCKQASDILNTFIGWNYKTYKGSFVGCKWRTIEGTLKRYRHIKTLELLAFKMKKYFDPYGLKKAN